MQFYCKKGFVKDIFHSSESVERRIVTSTMMKWYILKPLLFLLENRKMSNCFRLYWFQDNLLLSVEIVLQVCIHTRIFIFLSIIKYICI